MIDFKQYSYEFNLEARKYGYSDIEIEKYLKYAENLNNQNLPIIFDLYHFSKLVGYKHDFILKITNSPNLFYKEYFIPKRSGAYRRIDEPFPSLKEIQYWILNEILNNTVPKLISPVAKAYLKNRNIRDNARFHRHNKVLVCLDVTDFFGSISYKYVYSVYCNLGYSKPVASLLTNLCLLDDALPQGAPTSPLLSNLIFYRIDSIIFSFCKKNNIMYTRYADDLSFSGDFRPGLIISFVRKVLNSFGFKLNENKTKVISQGRSQQVTGIVVNEKIQVCRTYRKKVRQEIYYIVKFGVENHLKKTGVTIPPINYIYHLLGQNNYILQINKNDKEALRNNIFLKELLKLYKLKYNNI